MVNLNQMAACVVFGLIWIAIGLVPGVLETLVAGIYTLAEKLAPGVPLSRPHPTEIDRPRWFAVVGAAIIFFTMLPYLLPEA